MIKRIFLMVLTLLLLMPSAAQSRRRPATGSTPAFNPFKKSPAAEVTLSESELQKRNRELLQEIINLKNERDFYKKKLLEWSQNQEQPTAVETKPVSAAAAPAIVMPGYPPPDYYRAARRDTIYVQVAARTTSEDSLFYTARRQIQIQEYDQAVATYLKLLRAQRCRDEHRLTFGRLLYYLGDHTQAMDVLRQVAMNDSLTGQAAYFKARIHQQRGEKHNAEIEFLRNEIVFPRFRGYELGRAFTYLQQENFDSARVLFEKLISNHPLLSAECLLGLGLIAESEERFEDALGYYKKAVVFEPSLMTGYYRIGIILMAERQFSDAIGFLQFARQYDRASHNYDQELGRVYYFMKRWDEAQTAFHKARERFGETDELRHWLAKTEYIRSLLAYRKADFTAATQLMRRARQWDARATEWMSGALADLGRIYETDMEAQKALDYYIRSLQLHPGDTQTLLRVGVIYYQNGDWEAAGIALKRARVNPALASEADYWLGQITKLEAIN